MMECIFKNAKYNDKYMTLNNQQSIYVGICDNKYLCSINGTYHYYSANGICDDNPEFNIETKFIMDTSIFMPNDYVIDNNHRIKQICEVYVHGFKFNDNTFDICSHIKAIKTNIDLLELNGFEINETDDGLYTISLYENVKNEKICAFEMFYESKSENFYTTLGYNNQKLIFFNYVQDLQHMLRSCGFNELANNLKFQ